MFRWTENIAQKVNLKRKKKVEDNTIKQIVHSVFEPAVVLSYPSGIQVSRLGRHLGAHWYPTCRIDQDFGSQTSHDAGGVECVSALISYKRLYISYSPLKGWSIQSNKPFLKERIRR
jgi:hypothetical protein